MYARMNRAQAGVLLVLFAVAAAAVGATPAAGTAASSTVDGTAVTPPAETLVEADTVEFRVTVYANGSARWTFTYTRVLENDTERQRFETFAAEFEANETTTYRDFRRQARGLTATGRNATGREMTATDFDKSAGLGGTCVTQDCGTVRMSFTWEGFADASGDRVVVGDVFGTGLYVGTDQEFVVEAGPGLGFESASPRTYNDPDASLEDRRSITYKGEQSFSDRRPRIVFVPDNGTNFGTGTGPAGTDGTGTPDASAGVPMMLVAGLMVVLLGAGAAAARWRGGGFPVSSGGPDDGGAGAAGPSEPAVSEEELLTDEDRVLSLLEDNGGRMKQVHIVEETGWSKSKVSMLLSEMDDDGAISKLRVGRENIISISGQEPEAAGSPHEED
jgi:hypothetical protein